jgi:hypothetical protein
VATLRERLEELLTIDEDPHMLRDRSLAGGAEPATETG